MGHHLCDGRLWRLGVDNAMSEFWYLCSNGRCGTQFLARSLAEQLPEAVVIHERFGQHFAPREVFRDPTAMAHQVSQSGRLQGFLTDIEDVLASGQRFIFCGWPGFAWLDYFQDRYGAAFRFLHLTRNPYENAASHATHQPMQAEALSIIERRCKIFPGDPNTQFPAFAEMSGAFSLLDRHLYHWLELTADACDHSDAPGYRGHARFEDVFGDPAKMNAFLSQIAGRPVALDRVEPFDRVHRAAPWRLNLTVHPKLRLEVDRLARSLGYTQADLDAACDPASLAARYRQKRFDLPCDPAIPVIDPGPGTDKKADKK